MKTAAVRSGTVRSAASRLDAPFYLSEGEIAKRAIAACPFGTMKIGQATHDVFNWTRGRRIYVSDKQRGTPFLGGSTMLKADLSGVKLLSNAYTPDLADAILRPGWILISCSGTIGKTVFSCGIHDGMAASQHVMRVVPNGNVPAGILYAFLSTRYGFALLTQGKYGSVIDELEPDYIKSLSIPVFPAVLQRKVDGLVKDAAKKREEAAAALRRAEELFARHAGEESFGCGRRCEGVNIARVVASHRRLDAQYQIGMKLLDAEKRRTGLRQVRLSDVAKEIFIGNRGKRHYVAAGVPFVSSSDMMLFNPIREAKFISRNAPERESLAVHENDILISRSGTVGNVVIVGKDMDGVAVSEHAVRVVLDTEKISPLYVFAYLKTDHAKRRMECSAYGSVIITLNEELIGAIEIPVLGKRIYDEIVANAGAYRDKLAAAAEAENEAIGLVEREIASFAGEGK